MFEIQAARITALLVQHVIRNIKYMDENLSEYMTADQLFNWAKASMNIIKLNTDMTEDDFQRAMRWIGMCAVDTIYTNGDKPNLGRIGIGLMLFVTLMEFPELYVKYELAQWN